jgi:hypothetical protein
MSANKVNMVISLKTAVEKARCEKEWVSANPLVNKDFFIVTNEFIPFLQENDYFGRQDRAECAVLVTLAVVADSWTPPAEVIEEIMKLLRENIPDPREQPDRAPEIVIAYLLGWSRPDLKKSGASWESALPESRACLRAVVYVSTDSCLTWLNQFVIGFPTEDPGYWATRILNLFTTAHFELRCDCWRRAAPPGTTPIDVLRLRGNAKKKARTCLLQQHHLSLWNPLEMPLWHFADRAVKGSAAGKFGWIQFPTGMLFDRLWHSNERPGRVALVKVARRYCDSCGRWTVYSFCPSIGCDRQSLDSKRARVAATRWLILEGERGGFSPKWVWTCARPASSGAEDGGPSDDRCRNIYVQDRCDRRVCSKPHDCCPLCGAQHPGELQRRLSKVYFCEGDAGGEVSIDDYLERLIAETPEGESPAHVISEAAENALEEFGGRDQWSSELIFCLDGDFERWIGLVQSAGNVDWKALWDALKDAPDRPANLEDLKRAFETSVKPKLSEIFRHEFGLANLDWSQVENYRPKRSQGEEEG